MKHIYTIALMLLCHRVHAQVDSVQIGTGNSSFANTLYGPVYRFSATSATTHSRSNMLLTAAQLQAAGLPNGAIIQAVQFSKFSINGMIRPVSFKMYMANSVRDTLDRKRAWTSIRTTHTEVYSNLGFQLPLQDGWVPVPVSGFVYTGGAIEVATETVMQGSGGADGGIAWRYAPGTAKFIEGQTGINTAPDTLNGSNVNYLFRPDVRILYTMNALPVTLLSFTANRQGKDVLLNWKVSNETNIDSYQLQRSVYGSNYITLSSHQAAGTNSYHAVDANPPNGNLYYRIRMLEKDGGSSYSRTVKVKPMNKGFVAYIQANGLLQVQAVKAGKLVLQVYTMEGKLLHRMEQAVQAGNDLVWLPMQELAKGSYLLNLQLDGDGQVLKWLR